MERAKKSPAGAAGAEAARGPSSETPRDVLARVLEAVDVELLRAAEATADWAPSRITFLIDALLSDLDEKRRRVARVFLYRAIRLLNRLAHETPTEELEASVTAPTDVGALTRALTQTASEESLRALDPLAEAFARGAEIQDELLERAGGTWGVSRVAAHLQVSRQAVSKRLKRGSLLAVEVGDRKNYPLCQFDEGGVVDGLPEVLRAMPTENGWTRLSLLYSHTLRGEETTVLDAVRAGRQDDALHAVRSWGRQGAA